MLLKDVRFYLVMSMEYCIVTGGNDMTNSQQEPSSQSIKMISIVMKYPGILVQLLYQTPILVILPRRNMTDDLLDSEWSQVIWDSQNCKAL